MTPGYQNPSPFLSEAAYPIKFLHLCPISHRRVKELSANITTRGTLEAEIGLKDHLSLQVRPTQQRIQGEAIGKS
jgi:hypothetical protein